MNVHDLSPYFIAVGIVFGWQSRGASGDQLNNNPPTREWTDSTGRYHLVGSLLDGDQEHVRLQRNDGAIAEVPVARLSTEDRQYVAEYLEVHRQPHVDAVRATSAGESSISRTDVPRWWTSVAQPALQDIYRLATESPLLSEAAQSVPENMVSVRISARFLRQMAEGRVNRAGPVREEILGVQMFGTARTVGTTELALLPCTRAGLSEVRFQGTNTFKSVGYAGPITIHSSGVTTFQSVKSLWIDGEGIHLSPAKTQATTSTRIDGLETSWPRLLGRISLRVAERRAAQSHQLSEIITAEHTARKINRGFDADLLAEVNRGWKEVGAHVAALPTDHPLRPRGLQARSTPDELQITMLGPKGAWDDVDTEPVSTIERPDIEVRIHVSVVRRALADAQLAKLLRPSLVRFVSTSSSRDASLPTVRWTDDGKWLSLTWTADQSQADVLFAERGAEE